MKKLLFGLFVTVCIAAIMIYIMRSYVTFTIQSSRNEPINITDVDVSIGFVGPDRFSLNFRNMEGVAGFVFTKSAVFTLEIQSGSLIEHLECTIDTRGSDYCDIEIAVNGIGCDCYQ